MTTETEGAMDESGGDIAAADDIWKDAWDAHTHPDLEDEGRHVHAPDADWQVSFGMPMVMRHADNLDIIGLMEFRGVAMNMRAAMEAQKEGTDLQELEAPERQFTIIAYNSDVMMIDSLLAVVDQALMQHEINPPCQLQRVESSNVRSIGYVAIQAPGEVTPRTGTLYVAFAGSKTSPGLYRYEDVPMEVVNELVDADSKGSAFNRLIKMNYQYEKVI